MPAGPTAKMDVLRASKFAEAAARMESMIVAFAPILDNLPLEKSETVRSFSALIAPKNSAELDRLAGWARALTRQHLAAPCGSLPRFIFPTNASTVAVTADS